MFNNKNFYFNSKNFYKNLKKTKKLFTILIKDIKNFDIPVLSSYEKDYNFDFSSETIKKFSKFENIIIFGMGGSILGTKSIYSFFRKKIKKKYFFLII